MSIGIKKKRLFYWEEACNAFVPAPEKVENIIAIENLDDNEMKLIEFKCFEMTDEEMDKLPVD